MTLKAVTYWPAHVKEHILFQGHLISCTESSLAMLVDASTVGCIKITQELVRSLSSEPHPDPKSPGLNIKQIDEVAAKLHVPFSDVTGHSFAELITWLKAGRRAIVQVENADLHDCVNSRVGHAIYINHVDSAGVIHGDNPLCNGRSTYTQAELKKAMTTFARATGVTTGLRYGVSRPIPKLAVTV